MKKIYFIIIYFSIISSVTASIKENIIEKFTNIENVSFDFEQNINGKIDRRLSEENALKKFENQ